MKEQYLMKLPELNCLSPNEHTTFMKLVEEIAECNIALCDLKEYEESQNANFLLLSEREIESLRNVYKTKLQDVMGEIMDIAQVCASQLFVFEKKGIDIYNIFEMYLEQKGLNISKVKYSLVTENNCRYLYFSPPEGFLSLDKTMKEIISEMGKVAQLGKFSGANGEIATINEELFYFRYCFSLFEILRKCFDLIYNMESKYQIDIAKLFDDHVEKLVKRGYYKHFK